MKRIVWPSLGVGAYLISTRILNLSGIGELLFLALCTGAVALYTFISQKNKGQED